MKFFDHTLVPDFFDAITVNNVKKVRRMLLRNRKLLRSKDVEFKMFDSDMGVSPLWKAMLNGRAKVVELLIKKFGANPDEKCNIRIFKGYTFIQYCAENCNRSIVIPYNVLKVLIKHGADVNALLPRGENIKIPLQVALDKANLELAKFFLQHGANLKDAESLGDSPATFAFVQTDQNDCKEMLLFLLRHGLKTEFRNANGENLLHRFLSLADSSFNDMVEITKILIDNGVALNEVDNRGYRPIHLAIDLKNIKLVSLLCERGAIVNKCSVDDVDFPLGYFASVYDGDFQETGIDFVKVLISHGAEINAKNCAGDTAMHNACFRYSMPMISYFIQIGSDITIRNKKGYTPYSAINSAENKEYAIQKLDISKLFIKEYAKIKIENFSVPEEDLKYIEMQPGLQEFLTQCTQELKRMKREEFYSNYTYYFILQNKNVKEIASLTEKKKFLKRFFDNLSYSIYLDDLKKIIAKAVEIKKNSLIVYSKLRLAFGNSISDGALRKIAESIKIEDLSNE